MKPKFDEEAALYWFAGCFKNINVKTGIWDVSRARVTLIAPDGATVQRDKGPKGDGFEEPKEPSVPLPVMLLAFERLEIKLTVAQWKELFADAVNLKIKPKEHMPPEAIEAMKEILAAMPEEARPRDKTSSERIGVSMVQRRIERVTIAEFDRLKAEAQPNTRRMRHAVSP